MERDRYAFLQRKFQLAGRTNLSAEEIRQLGNDWTRTMVDQWQPILGFVERRIKHNGTQSPVDPSSDRRVSNGNLAQLDIPLALSYLLEQAGMVRFQDITSICLGMPWRRPKLTRSSMFIGSLPKR